MKTMTALIKREYLEHRGAFLYAPATILLLVTLALGTALLVKKARVPYEIGATSALKFFEVGFLGMGALWFVYLTVALFFYYADAFSADRRNNSMLFWKSMPVSDFTVLSSKMLAGMTLLPGLIFGALVASGLLLYGLTGLAVVMMPGLEVPGVLEVVSSSLQLGLYALVYLVLALLWYAPFYAWVGALSTVFRRWSIPLAFLIPGLLGLVENLFFYDEGPRGGYILGFLRQRLEFGPNRDSMELELLRAFSADSGAMLQSLLASIDWMQLAGGLIVAALAVYAASEYRRRVVST